ncbi:hypothetical protein FJT64_020180 [Amphibalanus amphitrite]|uniref:SEA domain-containing protein n=1 Tax=Amphibalanus amphitrite TaxID=1232801 RepID=A0A6A4WTQ2_AMPAM|nr:hypothetical protein FJT64_020180 [Amphibalanus amphitrite]
MKVRYTIPWNAEYAKSNSTEAEAKKQALKNNLEPPMKLKIPLMKELVINSLTQGSVVADYDVILNSDVEGGNVEAVTSAITEVTANGTIGDDPVSANDTAVVVLECTNKPEEAMANGMRSWSGSRALKTMVLYTCRTGYTLKNNGQSQANFTVTCQRSSGVLLFGGVPGTVSCVADPTTTTTTTTTTTEATTAEPTTTELTRPTPHETPYVPSEHTTFTNSLFLSITIPAVAGMVAALICFLCAIRIDSVLCKVCAEGKV